MFKLTLTLTYSVYCPFRVQRLLQWLCDHWSLVSLLLMFTLPRPALYCFTVASCLDRTQTRPQDHWPTPGLTVLTRVSAQNSVATLGLLHKNFSQTEAQNSICYILACPSPSPKRPNAKPFMGKFLQLYRFVPVVLLLH